MPRLCRLLRVITDFSTVDPTTGALATSGLSGSVFSVGPVKRDVSSGTLHASGPILGFGAFGVGFDCLDASRYSGISFKVSGNPGPSGMLSVAVNTEADTLRELGGTCVAEPSMCLPPSKNIAVDATPTTVSLAWADFAGGMPRATVDPTRVHAVVWSFAYAPASYAADITVDDLAFGGERQHRALSHLRDRTRHGSAPRKALIGFSYSSIGGTLRRSGRRR